VLTVKSGRAHRARSGSVWWATVPRMNTESPDRTPPQESAELPVRQPQLGAVERILAIDPAGEPADDPATIQAPPAPWRLTGTPAWRATVSSWATAGAGTAGDGQGQAAVGEQRPPSGTRCRVDERHCSAGKSDGSERRVERVHDDRLRRADGIGADPEHLGVARTQDAGGVGEDISPPSKTKPTAPRPARRSSTNH
jgi:hypothetical protein